MDRHDAPRRRARHAVQGSRDPDRARLSEPVPRGDVVARLSADLSHAARDAAASPPIARCCPTRATRDGRFVTLETGAAGRQLSDARVLGRVRARDRRRDRDARARRASRCSPPTATLAIRSSIAGGPLTFSNPAPLAPFCDVIIVGEGEELIVELVDARARASASRASALWAALAGRPGYYLPHVHGETRAAGRRGRRRAAARALGDRRRRTPSSPTCS